MSQISQNADGTYQKTYSSVELAIIFELAAEQKARHKSDQSLKEDILSIVTDVTTLKQKDADITSLVTKVGIHELDIEANKEAIIEIQKSAVVDSYSKEEIRKFMNIWRIDEISYPVVSNTAPKNEWFDEADMQEIRTGYRHYPGANINDAVVTTLASGDKQYSETGSISPNTVRRYSIMAYSSAQGYKKVTLRLRFGDACTVYTRSSAGETKQIFENPSFDTERVVYVNLAQGWTQIQLLIANGQQGGGLYMESDLATVAEQLLSLGGPSGRFSGNMIRPGSIDESHFNEDMSLKLKKLHATTALDPSTMEITPALIAGDGESGAIQIGDGIITKQRNEPYTLDGDIRIIGNLRDKDGNVINEDTFRNGLTTEEREKLNSVGYKAEENQMAFSYIEASGVPYPKDKLGNEIGPTHPDYNPLWNVLAAVGKTDTLRLRGDDGIIFDFEKTADGETELIIKTRPTLIKEEKFIAVLGQKDFVLTLGEYRPNTGTVQVYVDGQRKSSDVWDEQGDGKTIKFKSGQNAGTEVTVTWQEGAPIFGSETIITIADLPPATRTSSGLMTKEHVTYLYDHKHTADQIIGLPSQEEVKRLTEIVNNLQNELNGLDKGVLDRISALEKSNSEKDVEIADLKKRLEAVEENIANGGGGGAIPGIPKPTDLRVESATDSSIILSWSNDGRFVVKLSGSIVWSGTGKRTELSGLTPNTSHMFTVHGANDAGDIGYGAQITAVTLAQKPGVTILKK
ncbi:fibronectin type III domain-containing protein (plasmid) [Paenibacillus sp. EC2-1]|uniref:fibronectin type III domain-containing protein n=1 Tax=Paenibacillus sp. EC2-1 TaxID=3388665 RepID=UPI003BEECCA4